MKKKIPDVNEPAPEFSVLNENKVDFLLSDELQLKKNVLLIFYRGHW